MAGISTKRLTIKSYEDQNVITFKCNNASLDKGILCIEKEGVDENIIKIAFNKDGTGDASISLDTTESVYLYGEGNVTQLNILSKKKIAVEGNILSLLNNNENTSETIGANTFKGLFKNNKNLVSAEGLYIPEGTAGSSAYEEFFSGCESLEAGPDILNATTIDKNTYKKMFYNCKNLTTPPACNVSGNIKERAFESMFEGCEKLTSVMGFKNSIACGDGSEMKAMYKGCKALTTGYSTISFGFGISTYEEMFMDCSALGNSCEWGTVTPNGNNLLKSNCCKNMYTNSGVTTILIPSNEPENNATACFCRMYYNCGKLKNSINVTINLVCAESMCDSMFAKCIAIAGVNVEFKGKINTRTAINMFENCAELENISLRFTCADDSEGTDNFFKIYSKTVSDGVKLYATNCCENMFTGCGVTNISASNIVLPDYLGPYFCKGMFKNCKLLTNANINLKFYGDTSSFETSFNKDDPNINFAKYACQEMFSNCTKLNNISGVSITGYLPEYALESMFLNTKISNTGGIQTLWHAGKVGACKSMFKECENLTSVNNLRINGLLGNFSCEEMFYNCIKLNINNNQFFDYFYMKEYPEGCYKNMFNGCIALTNIKNKVFEDLFGDTPVIFHKACFFGMFNGCTNLENFLNTPNQLAFSGIFHQSACENMFLGCKKFPGISFLEIKNKGLLEKYSFSSMFSGCSAYNKETIIKISVDEPNENLQEKTFFQMFADCILLTVEPIFITENNNISYGKECFALMFIGCTELKTVKNIEYNGTTYEAEEITIYGNIFGEKCFYQMYSGCTDKTKSLCIEGNTLDEYACSLMYDGCIALEETPKIKVDKIGKHAFENAFKGCTGTFTKTNIIESSEADEYAFYQAFKDCTGLTTIPELKISKYGSHACVEMFMNSGVTDIGTSLRYATEVSDYSFYSMFENTKITSLENSIIPGSYINYQAVNAADLTEDMSEDPMYSYKDSSGNLYNYFFGPGRVFYIIKDIIINNSVIPAPEYVLDLKDYTFGRMFYGCTLLERPFPKMNNIYLANYTCYKMFANCTKLISAPEITSIKYEKALKPAMDADGWHARVINGLPMSGNEDAYTPSGKQIMKVTDIPRYNTIPSGAFCGMFMNTNLSTLPSLLATKIEANAANSMFRECKNLKFLSIITDVNINIKQAGDYAFSHMFDNCSLLDFSGVESDVTTVDIFKNLQTIGKYAFCGTFANCMSLKYFIKIDNLNISEGSFNSMYLNCSALGNTGSNTLELDFTNKAIGPGCFTNMFRNCVSLQKCIVKLNILTRSCCEGMFINCTNLQYAKIEFNRGSSNMLYALNNMFYLCQSLNEVWCNTTIPFSFNFTNNWLYGVATSGTFYYFDILNKDLVENDPSSVPEGWTMEVGYAA